HALCFELFVFSAMNIPVFYFFPQASIFQLSVIVLSYAFVVFYPLSIALHLFGFGGLLDSYLLDFLAYATKGGEIFIPTWLFVLFNLSLIFALRYKYCAVFVALSGVFIYFWGLFI
ncbi:MAG: ComEC/Rec2 family competence protein, partial [Campylobacter sp.]|nr:ComEC/Rec2 family competence protein [Campylobacter sp.]